MSDKISYYYKLGWKHASVKMRNGDDRFPLRVEKSYMTDDQFREYMRGYSLAVEMWSGGW